MIRTLMIIVMITLSPAGCWAGYDYIDITNPFLKKIPIAIPLFKGNSNTAEEKKAAENNARLLSETLEFTGYFKILDPDAFLEDPRRTGILASTINFSNWTGIGAELLITGGIAVWDDRVEMELRLFDTFKADVLVGKRYKGQLSEQRDIIRRFCGEVMNHLTGNRGFFNSKIAFLSTGTGNKEIYMCDFDGYAPTQLTHTKSITLSPAWSSDGKWIAYTSYEKGKPDLYIKNLAGKPGSIVAEEGMNCTPAWVPGQFALGATLSFNGDQEIYLLTGTGKIIKKLTDNWGIDVSPCFSPDGKKMAFVSKRSGTPQIYVKNIGSGRDERLTFAGQYNTNPSWSPVENKVAYSSLDNGQFNIYVIDIDKKQPIPLTQNAGDNESPTWSPDGSLIAFSSTREGISRIYVMTAYGTDQRRLLAFKGEQTSPSWSPEFNNN